MSPLALSLRFLQAQPDSRLAALAREGHEPAFEALVRRYRRELLAYCRGLLPQSGSAEDVLQQALLQAWKALDAGAEVRDPRPWLYRIVHNVAISTLRAAPVAHAALKDAGVAPSVDQLVEQRFQARAALAGIAALPELQRQVLVSTALDDTSHEELASMLGLSSGSVRGLIYRARATLRAAAAAVIPSPLVSWALRRAETRAGGTTAVVEALAGGGGAGMAGLVAKGGAVITLAGAVAGGGVILTHHVSHYRHSAARSRASLSGARSSADSTIRVPASTVALASTGAIAGPSDFGRGGGRDTARRGGSRVGGGSSEGARHLGSDGEVFGSSSGSGLDGGSASGRTDGSDGGSSSGSDGAGRGSLPDGRDGGGSGPSRAGRDGGDSGSGGPGGGGSDGSRGSNGSGGSGGGGPALGIVGSGGGTSEGGGNGGPGPTSSETTTTTTSTSGGGSGFDGGGSSGSGGSGSSGHGGTD